jgi:hypothetical protein
MRERSVVPAMREVASGRRTAGGKTNGKIAFHGGKVDVERPRLRGFDGKEHPVPRGSGCRRLARQMGSEPDADQRRDAEVRSIGSAA